MFELTPRLQMVAGLVPPCACAADVGTDHGLLLAALLRSGRCARGYGSDLRPGPLAAARRTIENAALSHRADLLLSDGADALPVEKIDALIFAGMGGELIAELILRDERLRDPLKTLVCQPMTRPARLRAALCRAGFTITREDACHEGQRFYQATVFVWDGESRVLSDAEAVMGRLPFRENADAAALLRREVERLRRVAAVCGDSVQAEADRRLAGEIEARLSGAEDASAPKETGTVPNALS